MWKNGKSIQIRIGLSVIVVDAHCRTGHGVSLALVVSVTAWCLVPGAKAVAENELCEPPGTYAWVDQFGTGGKEIGRDLAVDSTGNVYVTGYTTGTYPGQKSMGGWDTFLAKYNSDGTQLWVKQFGASNLDRGVGVAVDGTHAVYVAGVTLGTFPGEEHSGGGTDAFLAKFSSEGEQIWVRQFGAGNSDQGYRVVVDNAGDVFVSGSTLGIFPGEESEGDRDAFLAKYTPDGTQLWVRQIGSSGGDSGPALTVDSVGNAYIAGYTTGALPEQEFAGGVDTFLVKYSSDGRRLWIRQFGTSAATIATDLAIDTTDAIYVSGHTAGALPGEQATGDIDAYIAKYNPDGTQLWVRQFGAGPESRGYGVAVDQAGGVYVTGYTMGAFPGQDGGDGANAFLARYSPGGTQLWVGQSNTNNDHFGRTIGVDAAQGVYIAGWTVGSFPAQQSGASPDPFLFKWDDCHPFTVKPGHNDPPQQPVVNLPPFADENNLIFVTHGCCTTELSFAQTWAPWKAEMIDRLDDDADWLVYVHDWSPSPEMTVALKAAVEEAKVLGPKIASAEYEHVHLIAHGAGSAMITMIACLIEQESPSTTVHLTYLDAFTGVVSNSGISCVELDKGIQSLQDLYGQFAVWSDHYRADDPCWTGTHAGTMLPNAHNIDVTKLDPDEQSSCKSSHDWPRCFYRYTINGSAEPCSQEDLDEEDYFPFGFPLSLAKFDTQWEFFVQQYPPGEVTELREVDGSPIANSQQSDDLAYRIRVDDLINLGAMDIFTETPQAVMVEGTTLTAKTALQGGPVWINFMINTDLPTNFIRFDAEFTSKPRTDGLLTLYLNGRSIGFLNEQTVSEGALTDVMMHESLEPGDHVLSFRIDDFSGTGSDLHINNVATGRAAFVNVADVNVDGLVDVFDLLILISQWGSCDDPEDCPADLNGDGEVDALDLLKLISHWG